MRWTEENDDHIGIISAIVILVALILLATLGCRSTPCVCPPVMPPKIVHVPITVYPAPLPTPRPPELRAGTLAQDSTVSEVLAAVVHDVAELLRSLHEAVGTIDAANERPKEKTP